jgi:hypothetical protein
VIWPDDHEPPHVHVFRAGRELIINLGVTDQLPYVRDNYGMRRNDQNIALLVVAANKRIFWERWKEING